MASFDSDMLPVPSHNHVANHLLANAKLFAERLLRYVSQRIPAPDFPHCIFVKNSCRCFLPASRSFGMGVATAGWSLGLAILRAAIPSIVEIRSKKEMVGIYARGSVALVTNEHPIGDIAESDLPRKTVSHPCFYPRVRTTRTKASITVPISVTFPNPA